MTKPQKLLLLIASSKLQGSTSESLGTFLRDRLQELGLESETLFLQKAFTSEAHTTRMLESVRQSDLLILAFPLYVDSLPAVLIRTLEDIAGDPDLKAASHNPRLVCIANCGFPESHQNDTALAICRQFALETGLEWAGGLQLGAGEAISGRPLPAVKGLARNVIKALRLSAEALAAGRPVPEKARALMAKPLIPVWLYCLIGERRWRQDAKKHGVLHSLDARPYGDESKA
jgi:hypothetical protein